MRLRRFGDFLLGCRETIERLGGAESERGWQATLDELESICCKAVYARLFAAFASEPADGELAARLARLGRVPPQALEVDPAAVDEEAVAVVCSLLEGVAAGRAPREKLDGLVDACRLLCGTVRRAGAAGADAFLPALVLCVARARPAAAWANLAFVRHLRRAEALAGEADYYLTAYESALEFLHGEAGARLEPPRPPSPAPLPAPLLGAVRAQLRFANAQFPTLLASDVPALLDEYALVLQRYAQLSAHAGDEL